jgi:hypothetical protein
LWHRTAKFAQAEPRNRATAQPRSSAWKSFAQSRSITRPLQGHLSCNSGRTAGTGKWDRRKINSSQRQIAQSAGLPLLRQIFGVTALNWGKAGALLVVILLLNHNTSIPQEYQASGIFGSEDYSPQYAVGKPARIIEGSLLVSVRGCQSFIEYRVTNAVSHSEFLAANPSP